MTSESIDFEIREIIIFEGSPLKLKHKNYGIKFSETLMLRKRKISVDKLFIK